MTQEELKALINKRGMVKATLTRMKHFVDNFQPGNNVYQLKTRLPHIQKAFTEFDDIQRQIELLDNRVDQSKEREEFENKYYDLESAVLEIIDTDVQNSANERNTSSPSSSKQKGSEVRLNPVRLPTLDLPVFSGSYLDWQAFSDTFKSLIHDNELYTNIEKFHYLRSCLKGGAYKTLESVKISSDNYPIAWKTLEKRYANTRLIVQEHVLAIINSPNLIKNSATAMRKLLDDITVNTEALKNLQIEVDKWDALIVPLITLKFDFITKRDWESTLDTEVATLTELICFLSKKAALLESLNVGENYSVNNNKFQHSGKFKHNLQVSKQPRPSTSCNTTVTNDKVSIQCFLCKGAHTLYRCNEFLSMSVADRTSTIKKLKLCLNCFKRNHSTEQCKSGTCRQCQEKHNSLLHREGDNQQNNSSTDSGQTIVSHARHNAENSTQVLLSTVQIFIRDCSNNWVMCRALLDSGSQSNFITQLLCNKLGLSSAQLHGEIIGINGSRFDAQRLTKIHIKSRYDNHDFKISCFVLSNITQSLPSISFEKNDLQLPSNLKLADNEFNIRSPVDILLGAEIFWKAIRMGQIKLGKNSLHLQESCFGWIVGGTISTGSFMQNGLCNLSLSNLDKQVRAFWETEQWPGEEGSQNNYPSQEDKDCENHFLNTHKRDPSSGRFIVRLPFKCNPVTMGRSDEIARKRFTTLENKLKRNESLRIPYKQFMDEYSELNHMELIPGSDSTETSVYLPHHAVVKESSTTTKLRVVFDASAKTSKSTSLNDFLSIGPKLQDDLCAIILRFRSHQYVITGDINKMYRQILVAADDRKYQRIFWRDDCTKPLDTYQLNTVTYGTACAPFLAVRCLKELADENKVAYPHIYPVIIHDMYMDDVLTGGNTIADVLKLREDLIKVLSQGQFELRKWAANNLSLLTCERNLPDTSEFDNGVINFDKNGESKTLGLYWNCQEDYLKYEINVDNKARESFTKRKILSTVSKIFDPLNLLGPVIVKAKLIIQRLWEMKLGWDERIPAELVKIWLQLLDEFTILNNIRIPRKVISHYPYSRIEMHGFCDASQRAYGACVYIRTHSANGSVSSNLLCSKSRVAPLKTITIPRLELCAALLLAKLVNSVIQNLRTRVDEIFYWTDSMIVLAWLATSPSVLNTYVANRVSQIQTLTTVEKWHHVISNENPADIISRGALPSELINNQKWFNGPVWLSKREEICPDKIVQPTEILEVKRSCLVGVSHSEFNFLERFSSFFKLQRVIANCFRFIHNCRNKGNKVENEFSRNEYARATTAIISMLQKLEFSNELIKLGNNLSVSKSSKLRTLNPFLDKDGIIRVGGRLRNASIGYEQKHPIVLPKHHVTKLIIQEEHVANLHAGPTATLTAIRLKFWPLAGRAQVRQVIHNCYNCFRVKPVSVNPIMGDLPASRMVKERPFKNTGLDYAGPLFIRDGKTRNRRTVKSWSVI
ncbi:uncharacterized protein LOC135131904 isoform X2 [Zophobas morio]|uniref:uncharacterized protein LOC135131904 isoform X2 n=1 Tax=Zophobas morio TaxID=2755281 RepID=UPI003083B202